jgi:hypothetical protein
MADIYAIWYAAQIGEGETMQDGLLRVANLLPNDKAPVALSDDDLLRIATTLGLPFAMLDTDYCKSMEIEPGTRAYGEVTCEGMVRFARAVLAATPQPVALTPLTRDQIDAVWSSMGSFTDRQSDYRLFARAIEAAHGIAPGAKE